MPAQAVTVPCQYRTGRTLGSGTYAIVKEAIHIKTGQYYACKVINKKLMEGREHMVRNEIEVLKRISSGHSNIVTLHDYFETSHNLYLCFDICTGGELFDSICARGQYTEADAAELVRTIFGAVKYIHDAGVVHRDLKPENLLFRSKPEKSSEIMIADFGLSRVMPDSKLSMLTEVCGTPGYMAPEIFKKTGHGKPVDVWAMGVITYFLLAGYTPFDRDTPKQEMEAIIAGDYQFEPAEYWDNVSSTARQFVATCLTVDPNARPTAAQTLEHSWLTSAHCVETADGQPADLLPHVKKAFDARKTFRKAVFSMMAMKRMSTLAHHLSPEQQQLNEEVYQYKQESEREAFEDIHVIHHHNADIVDHLDADAEEETETPKVEENGTVQKATAAPVDGPSSQSTPSVALSTGSKEVTEKLAAVSLAAKNCEQLRR
ncbi:Pkinase-domain-containing protein [Melanogaster broomeanus]|nr:Pkinase-domain-containing protein [Melanogaster broomeanus]